MNDILYAAADGKLSFKQKLPNGTTVGEFTLIILSLFQSIHVNSSFWAFRDTFYLEVEVEPEADHTLKFRTALTYFHDSIQELSQTFQNYILFMVSRFTATKGNKQSLEQDYRKIFESLIHEIVSMLGMPEWPVTVHLAIQIQRFMVQVCESSLGTEKNLKLTSLDWLGSFVSKLRAIESKVEGFGVTSATLKEANKLEFPIEQHKKLLSWIHRSSMVAADKFVSEINARWQITTLLQKYFRICRVNYLKMSLSLQQDRISQIWWN